MNYLLYSNGVTGLGTEIIEFLDHTLVAIGVLSQRVNDPELTQVHCSGDSGGFRVSGNELDILDTATLIELEDDANQISGVSLHWEW